jgi:hypothetical protein
LWLGGVDRPQSNVGLMGLPHVGKSSWTSHTAFAIRLPAGAEVVGVHDSLDQQQAAFEMVDSHPDACNIPEEE